MKLFISFWINYYKIAWYFPPCTIPPCRLVLDINLWVVLVPPKLNFWGTLLTEYLIWFIFLYVTAGFFLFTYFVQQLYTLYYDTLQISYPGRYLIRISLNHDSSWGQAVTPHIGCTPTVSYTLVVLLTCCATPRNKIPEWDWKSYIHTRRHNGC